MISSFFTSLQEQYFPSSIQSSEPWRSLVTSALIGVCATILVKVASRIRASIRASRRQAAAVSRRAAQKPGTVYLFVRKHDNDGVQHSVACYRVELYLKLRGAEIPHVVIGTHDTDASDTERLPFIELNGKQLTDSRFIIDFLEKEFPNNAPPPLNRRQECQLQTLLNTCELLKFAHYRATIVDLPQYSIDLFSHVLGKEGFMAKFLLRRFVMSFVRPDLIDWLNRSGFGDLSDEQYRLNFERDLQTLDDVLCNLPNCCNDDDGSSTQHFILGTKHMTKADCLIAPYIRSAVKAAGRSPDLCKLVPAYSYAASRTSFEKYLKNVDIACGI